MKVFELAKELDMGAIELVEKLKDSGMSVRNHMVALSDDELEKARELFKVVEVAPAKKKVVRKKKVTKKKTVEKVTAAGDDSEAPKEAKKVTKKKKLVTVKRKSKQDLADEKAAKKEEKAAEELEASQTTTAAEETASKVERYVEEKPKGLEVVYNPESAEPVAQEVKDEATGETKKVFKEKMHSFTPVYVPPVEEKKKA